MTALKTLLFTILVPGTVAVFIPLSLLNSASASGTVPVGSLRYGGLVLLGIGLVIYLWCAWDFTSAGKGTPAPIDPPKNLVIRGLYKYVRNPMYVGVLCVVLGQAIWFESRILFGYAALVFMLFNAFVLLYEEPALRQKFGDTYRQYCSLVPRWIPRRPQ